MKRKRPRVNPGTVRCKRSLKRKGRIVGWVAGGKITKEWRRRIEREGKFGEKKDRRKGGRKTR